MSVAGAIATILEADADLFALTSTRIWPIKRPQESNTVPAITYRLTQRRNHTKDGTNVRIYEVSFDLFANNQDELLDLEDKLFAAFDRYPIGSLVGGVTLDGVESLDSSQDEFDPDEDGVYSALQEYNVRVKV